MGKKHSDATKAKISAGMKATHEKKRDQRDFEASPTRQRVTSLAENFAVGHPDGTQPARIRNFGSLGRDVKVHVPEKRADPGLKTREEKVEAARTTAEALGLRRASNAGPKQGERGGKARPPGPRAAQSSKG